MKNKILFLCTLCMVLFFTLQAQTLSPTAVSSSGGFYSSADAMLSFTVAEMVMVETFTKPSNILTQGFQQPEGPYSTIEENEIIAGDIVIYPNPSSGQFNLTQNSDCNAENIIKIYNLFGQVVLTKSYSVYKGMNIIKFDITNCSMGIYLLELTLTDQKGKKNKSVHRINLVN